MVIFRTLITVFLKIVLTICLPVLAVRNPKQTISGRFKAWSSHWLVEALLRWDKRSSFVFVFCVYFVSSLCQVRWREATVPGGGSSGLCHGRLPLRRLGPPMAGRPTPPVHGSRLPSTHYLP